MAVKIVLALLLIVPSCIKDDMPAGDYSATFRGTFIRDSLLHNYGREYPIQVSESNKNSLIVQYENITSELSKDNQRIFGVLDFIESGGSGTEGHSWGPISLSGTWKNDKDRFTISGDFSRIYKIISAHDSTVSEFPITGTFEIKSKF